MLSKFQCWTLESPLGCKEIKPANPKEKSTLNIHWKNCCWSWSSSTLATWCELIGKKPWCWESKRRGGWQRVRWLDSNTDSIDINLSKLQKTVRDTGAWRSAVYGIAKSWRQLSDRTATTTIEFVELIELCWTVCDN